MKHFLITLSLSFALAALICGCSRTASEKKFAGAQTKYCAAQAVKTLETLAEDRIPTSIPTGTGEWDTCAPGERWICGFWDGQLWYLYAATGDEFWKEQAVKAADLMLPVAYFPATSHDVGFMIMPSIGGAYKYTGEQKYRDALVAAADSLATLYNPAVGTILSWPEMVDKMNWPHNTIIDNMLNLELLFWVGENCGRPDLTQIAVRHAEVTMEHQFRPDHSTYHVTVYDKDGAFLTGHTHQGWKDESTWARGQAWAVYGFTMAYRFTKDDRFLQTARDAADYFLGRLPSDGIPFWDFDAGEQLPDQPKDCSAAAIAASGLLELCTYLPEDQAPAYREAAVRMLHVMSQPPYIASDSCPAFLLHSTGHMPGGSEVDVAINYADYYYIEALYRLLN